MSKRKMCPRWVDKDCRHFASGPHEGKCTMIHKTNNKCELVPRKAKPKWVKVKAWGWVDRFGRVEGADISPAPSKFPCFISVEAKWLKGRKG